MERRIFKVFFSLLAALVVSLAGCDDPAQLAPFSSDGCSLFPDHSLLTHQDWCSCCFDHDIAYWRGGTQAERERADTALKQCVRTKSGDETLANLMYEGVRFGGSPYFYNWYRWGYGWPYDRKYRALTADERALADTLLQDYLQSKPATTCATQ